MRVRELFDALWPPGDRRGTISTAGKVARSRAVSGNTGSTPVGASQLRARALSRLRRGTAAARSRPTLPLRQWSADTPPNRRRLLPGLIEGSPSCVRSTVRREEFPPKSWVQLSPARRPDGKRRLVWLCARVGYAGPQRCELGRQRLKRSAFGDRLVHLRVLRVRRLVNCGQEASPAKRRIVTGPAVAVRQRDEDRYVDAAAS